MKRLLSIAVVMTLIIALATSALAGGHHGGGHHSRGTVKNTRTVTSTRAATYPASYIVCGIEDCELAGLHYHNGRLRVAHYYDDGHDYHDYCAIESCDVTGYHHHDDYGYCFGHSNNDGHSYHAAYGGHH